jgi:hypothetical protein
VFLLTGARYHKVYHGKGKGLEKGTHEEVAIVSVELPHEISTNTTRQMV